MYADSIAIQNGHEVSVSVGESSSEPYEQLLLFNEEVSDELTCPECGASIQPDGEGPTCVHRD